MAVRMSPAARAWASLQVRLDSSSAAVMLDSISGVSSFFER